ncbi:hypothetical protein HYH03_015378 [Edaphochlamys debaryana]|uniref:alcohol dehydrogenase (NADP(+)) n=1 Tax=Edaphochlamys debaryana TaxID=47281 RepID=A0A836BSL2_9CHLO|nr:hypothetical protein HYH03_015378 [Edaphochlamys debaryana]|eukprot:KAG2485934.1 hypothetical protein HYH03_015378 [Edaphochlamys debaryana]
MLSGAGFAALALNGLKGPLAGLASQATRIIANELSGRTFTSLTGSGQARHDGQCACASCAQTRSFASSTAKLLSRRGMVVAEAKARLKPWTYTVGELGPSEVDIRVTHNGLCHTDLHMRDNDWGVSGFPFIPGHEVVGELVAVGSAVRGLRPGSRAGVGWISNSCRCCANCVRGEENICSQGYTGLIVAGNHGGFQDVCRVNADFAYPIPDGLASADAAPLLCAGITVYSPLRAHIRHPGAHVGVMGVGGLGHLALQYANKMGAEVTGLDVWSEKEAEAKSLGAHHFAVWGKGTERLKGAFDVLVNTSSADIPTPELMALLKVDGTLVQVGLPGGGAVMKVPLLDLVFNQKRVVGSIVGGRADMQEMLNFSAVHGVKPLLELMPMSKVNEAMQRVAEGKARYRIVLTSDWQ